MSRTPPDGRWIFSTLSGCALNSLDRSGTWSPSTQPVPSPNSLQVDERLRAPALAEDWAAWAEAWQALDAGPVTAALGEAEAGREVRLTLAGERHAQTFAPARRPWWRSGLLAPRQRHAAPWLAGL